MNDMQFMNLQEKVCPFYNCNTISRLLCDRSESCDRKAESEDERTCLYPYNMVSCDTCIRQGCCLLEQYYGKR